ncbi:MAG: carbonate dehydratase [Deltaproteobacteria bacterium]|nr:carbonate dehydratase [Deltaproteobacteria bacterium]
MPPDEIAELFRNNRAWAEQMTAEDPEFFRKLAQLQAPKYLWIGCSDSRVPANQITGLMPGEVFVHRNIANMVVHTDLNCLSVIQFAVDVLQVRHIMVVGHYGCGGVNAALEAKRLGLIDNWLRHIQDVADLHRSLLDTAAPEQRRDRLCELNVIEQAANVARTNVVQDAWASGRALTLHGWVYRLSDGLLRDTGLSASSMSEMRTSYGEALLRVGGHSDART